MPGQPPIFSKAFLKDHLDRLRPATDADILNKKQILQTWIDTSQSGKLTALKEEEIKSRFLMEVFGDILGFNYKNTDKWLYREEAKTKIDGTKPDAALGMFQVADKGISGDVRIVIEVKNANTDLDKPQNRAKDITPVDQAFLYASKMGTDCRWIVVTNMVEIRFYRNGDQTRFQQYLLTDLTKEDIFQEFLFLFHRNHFFATGDSPTDRLFAQLKSRRPVKENSKHLVDELYHSLFRFDDLPFVDPRHIANFKPFNILNEYVWHYTPYQLFTLNKDIYRLLCGVKIENGEIIVDQALADELAKSGVKDYQFKLQYAFSKLSRCLVKQVSALADPEKLKKENKNTLGFSVKHVLTVNNGNGTILDLKFSADPACDCISCNYRSLNFKQLIRKLGSFIGKPEETTLECAYGHYLLATDDYKKAFHLNKRIAAASRGDDRQLITYLIANYNLVYLHNLLFDNEVDLKHESRSIELERIINDELDIFIDKDVRSVLIDLKEDKLFEGALKKARHLLRELEQLKALYDHGGKRHFGPDYVRQLLANYALVYAHYQKNWLVSDAYNGYRELITIVFKGLLTSFRTREIGLQKFNEFLFTEVILYIPTKDLRELLLPSEVLFADDQAKEGFLLKVGNLLKSYYEDGIFGDPHENPQMKAQLLNYHFCDRYRNWFANCCLIIAHLDTNAMQFAGVADDLIKFIGIEDILHFDHIAELGDLLKVKGWQFSFDQLGRLLNIAISRHQATLNKYDKLIRACAEAIKEFYPEYRVNDRHLVKKGLINCSIDSNRTDLIPLVPVWYILNDELKEFLSAAFEDDLDREFNEILYERLLKTKVISYDRKNYLRQLADRTDKTKGAGFKGIEDGLDRFDDYVVFNFLLIPYLLDIAFDLPQFNSLTGLSGFERWLQNPAIFDYNLFNPEWLKAANHVSVLKRLRGNHEIKIALQRKLKVDYDNLLSEIYFKYFA